MIPSTRWRPSISNARLSRSGFSSVWLSSIENPFSYAALWIEAAKVEKKGFWISGTSTPIILVRAFRKARA